MVIGWYHPIVIQGAFIHGAKSKKALNLIQA